MSQSINLVCDDKYHLAVRDLSSFLWDIALLHDRVVTFWQNPNDPLLYTPDFYRRWRRLPPGLDLKVGKISRDSPPKNRANCSNSWGHYRCSKNLCRTIALNSGLVIRKGKETARKFANQNRNS